MISKAVFLLVALLAVTLATANRLNRSVRASPLHTGGNPNIEHLIIGDLLDEPEYKDANFHKLRAIAFQDPQPKKPKGSTRAVPFAAAPGMNEYEKYALKLWIVEEFLRMYEKYSIPQDQDQINQGKRLFNELKMSNFEIKGISGIVHDLDTSKLKEIVATWNEKELISDLDRTEFTNYLDSTDFQKTSRGSALVRSNGEIIFSQVGYATTELATNKKGTWAYTFRKVKFTVAPKVTTTYTTNCVLWGIFCETKYDIKVSERTLTGAEGEALAAYIRSEALKQFSEDNGPFISMLLAKAKKFKPFLPKEVQDAVDKLQDNKDKKPDDVLPKDPLNGNDFDL